MFWVAIQSNLLADLNLGIEEEFRNAFQEMIETLTKKGWILPKLQANMRNQVNIANIEIQQGSFWTSQMESAIEKLKSGSTLIGEIPLLIKISIISWHKKKDEILKYCIDLMKQKNEKNTVILYDNHIDFEDIAEDIKRLVDDKKVVEYPSQEDKHKGISNVIDFIEKHNHILVTKSYYFNGCEASNVIHFCYDAGSLRNCLLRGVQNVLCVQLMSGGSPKLHGMKEDNRFL